MSDLTTNMTDARLEAIMDSLPEELDEAELCALTLTMLCAYCDSEADVIPALIAMIYSYGMSKGLSRKTISLGLRMTADMHDTKPETQH